MLHVDPHQRLTAPQVLLVHNMPLSTPYKAKGPHWLFIEISENHHHCDTFQVLRHPWIVERDQLSDRALTRQDSVTVKVGPCVNLCVCMCLRIVADVDADYQ